MKAQILEAMGEAGLQRSVQLSAALAANDRLKYYFSLLQAAIAHADHPEQPAAILRQERLACGIDDSGLDNVVTATRRENGHYRLPNCAEVLQRIAEDLHTMATPVLAGEPQAELQNTLRERLERLLSALPGCQDDQIAAEAVSAITRARPAKADSLHQMVMDLHKALNKMQAELAEDRLDGAAVYGIEDTDRPLIAAFMAGLNRTAPLKFSHPGLATTATRAGNSLVIQNDIGTTDAHVIVIHVQGMTVEITYTDVHPERVQFLRDMLKSYPVSWGADRTSQAPSVADGAAFYLATGHFEATDDAGLRAYLGHLASRLVFLIDWNRARKQLRGFLNGRQRIALLAWAAEAEVGHRGFLELGGARLINQAIEATGGSAMHFGDRLCDVLGEEAAQSLVQFVFRAATEGLRDHKSPSLIQDRVRAELQTHFASQGTRLLQLASDHAGMIFEIATLVRDGIREIGSASQCNGYQRLAKRAGRFEHEADQLVSTAREEVRRRPEYTPLFRVVEAADDAADELEEAAFLLELLAESKAQGEALQALEKLADLLVEDAEEWIKALSHAAHGYTPRGAGAVAAGDADDFLIAIDKLCELEHSADDAERALVHAAVQRASNFRQLHMYSEMGRSLESASDALKWAGLITRDHLLGTALGV
ncbi:MAG: DUF47 family protein [Bryobacteraceae bacterium]|jgi:uncharacterized protein Yka (UPF0111/DUF47 family)